MTKTVMIFLVAALLLFVMLAIGVKMVFFPSVNDTYFAMNQASLRRVPSGIVVIRPTHFPKSMRRGVMWAQKDKGNWHIMGRNVSLQDIFAAAYGDTRGRVQMPPDAPTNNFDFLITSGDPRQRLQKAIRSTFGYTADHETNDTDVLALKVMDPTLPGLTVSGPNEKEDNTMKKGQLYVTHLRLKELDGFFEQVLKTPIVDQTGLTNYYDFSLAWSSTMMMKLQNESTARPIIDKWLTGWGLGLVPDTAPMDMLVVKKVYN